jgi:hypothetical protein
MKIFCLNIILLIAVLSLHAEKGLGKISKAKEGSAQLTFDNPCIRAIKKNPVLVIYDRFDRSGAGVIYKVFYPAKDHTISIDGIPTGKYFVTIECLGARHARYETVVKIKSGKCVMIPISGENSDEFSKDNVVIPSEHMDFANLKITSMK